MTKIQCPNCSSYDTINQFDYIRIGIAWIIVSLLLALVIPLFGVPLVFIGDLVLSYGLTQKSVKKVQRQIKCKNCNYEFSKP